MAGNSPKKQQRGPGRPFPKGQSGNPAGKPPGAVNHATRAVQELLDGEAEKLTRRCIDLALSGDPTALRLCIERLAPAPKERRIAFDIPKASTAKDISAALAHVTAAVGAGLITPGEGNSLASLLEAQRRAIETADLEQRIERLEAARKEA